MSSYPDGFIPNEDDTAVIESRVRIKSDRQTAVCDDGTLVISERDRDGFVHDTVLEFATIDVFEDFVRSAIRALVNQATAEHAAVIRRSEQRTASEKDRASFDLLGDPAELAAFARSYR